MSPVTLELLYENGPCLVVNKPGGLLTQGPPGIDSLELRVKQFLKERDLKTGNIYLSVLHRLDRPVSGALILCKHVRAARRVAEQFQRREIEKIYWALVEGQVAEKSGTWTDFMRKIPDVAKAERVEPDHPGAKQGVLHFRRLAEMPGRSLLEIRLETGRMHQIRLQAAVRGHAILGDHLYGNAATFGPATDDPRGRWIALHACRLRFRHPMTREWVAIDAPLPRPWWPQDQLQWFNAE